MDSKDDPPTVAPPGDYPSSDRPRVDDEGVDVTLIRWMLSLTPVERLQALQQFLRSVEELRHGRLEP